MSTISAKPRFGLKLLAVLVIVGAGVYAGIQLFRPVAVVEPVVTGDALDAKTGSVTVVEEYSEELKSEEAGRVLNKDFKLSPGEVVKMGEIVAQLDPTDLKLAIERDKIGFDAAKARFAADHTKELARESANAVPGHRRAPEQARRSIPTLPWRMRSERLEGLGPGDGAGKDREQQETLDTNDNTLKVEERQLQTR